VRFFGKQVFAQDRRRFDKSTPGNPHLLTEELMRVLSMFKNLVTDHVIEFLIFKWEILPISLQKMLVLQDPQVS